MHAPNVTQTTANILPGSGCSKLISICKIPAGPLTHSQDGSPPPTTVLPVVRAAETLKEAETQANCLPEKPGASSGALLPHLSCLNPKLKLMPVSPDTGVSVLDGAGETLRMKWQNATHLQQHGLAQQCFSGLGHPGPCGSARTWGPPLLPSLPAGFLHGSASSPSTQSSQQRLSHSGPLVQHDFPSLSGVLCVSRAALESVLAPHDTTL